MTKTQKLLRNRRNADIIAGATMIITALDDYQAVYHSVTGSKTRKCIHAMLESCGITMEDVQARREITNLAQGNIACGVGEIQVEKLKAEKGRWKR